QTRDPGERDVSPASVLGRVVARLRAIRSMLGARHAVVRYGVAVVTAAAVSAAIIALGPLWQRQPSPPFLLLVLVVAWSAGLGPALMVCGLSVLVIDHFFLSQGHGLAVGGQD